MCLYVIIEIGKSELHISLFRLISANNGACKEPIIIVILGFYRHTARPLRDHWMNQRMMIQTERWPIVFIPTTVYICFVLYYFYDSLHISITNKLFDTASIDCGMLEFNFLTDVRVKRFTPCSKKS